MPSTHSRPGSLPFARRRRALRHVPAVALALAWIAACGTHAWAIPASAVLGADATSGPHDRSSRGALAALALAGERADGFAGVVRYDDSVIGEGWAGVAGLGVTVVDGVALRAQATRFVGDDDFRGWRVGLGPRFTTPAGASFGALVQCEDHTLAGRTWGLVTDAELPLVPAWRARFSASMTREPGATPQGQALAGLAWAPVSPLQLSLSGGIARGTTGGLAPQAPSRGLPILGGGETSEPESVDDLAPVVSFGLRLVLP